MIKKYLNLFIFTNKINLIYGTLFLKSNLRQKIKFKIKKFDIHSEINRKFYSSSL